MWGEDVLTSFASSPVAIALVSGGFTLLGVGLGGIGGLRQAKATLAGQARQQERKDNLARLEELYELVGRWSKCTIADHIVFRSVMQGKIEYNEALDHVNKDGRMRFDSSRMVALGRLYFPQIEAAFLTIHDADEAVNSVQAIYKEEYKRVGPASLDRSRDLNSALRKLDEAVESYKAELAKLVDSV